MQEDPRNKFARVAVKRTNCIVDKIRQLGEMSRRSYYDWHPDQVKVIFAAIRNEVDAAEKQFLENPKRFTLSK